MNATQLNRPKPLEPQELLALESLVATAATALATTFTTTLRLLPIATFAYQPHIIRCQVHGAAAELSSISPEGAGERAVCAERDLPIGCIGILGLVLPTSGDQEA